MRDQYSAPSPLEDIAMFGFFKSRRNTEDELFKSSLIRLNSLFSANVEFLNRRQSAELIETVLSVYLERNLEEIGQTTSEFYFNSLTGNICDAIENGVLDKHVGLLMWRQTSKFLLEHRNLNDKIVSLCMSNWKFLLIRKGIDPMNFEDGFYSS